jgi:hypothetical protein
VHRIGRVLREPRRLPMFLQAGIQLAAYRGLTGKVQLPKLLRRSLPASLSDRRDAELLRDYLNWWLRRSANPCLPRALASYHALRRIGEQPQFVISVRSDKVRSGAEVLAHAWVELDGQPYREIEPVHDAEWVEIFRHPRPGAGNAPD